MFTSRAVDLGFFRAGLLALICAATACGGAAGNGGGGLTQTGEDIRCGDRICGGDQICLTDCCTSTVLPCYAKPASGCAQPGLEIPTCNGVVGACACAEEDPSRCPPPPPCGNIAPVCVPYPGPGLGNPCPSTGGKLDTSRRYAECLCGVPADPAVPQ